MLSRKQDVSMILQHFKEYLDTIYSHLVSTLDESARTGLLEQSFDAFLEYTKSPADASRMAAVLNVEIARDSKSDDTDNYVWNSKCCFSSC